MAPTKDGQSAHATSRRGFLAAGAAVLATTLVDAQAVMKTQVWVQLTTGGKPYPPTLQEMFLDPMFFGMEIWPIDQPASFAALAPTTPQPQRSGAPAAGRGALGGGTERDEPADYPWEPSGGRPHPGYDVLVLNDQMNWPEPTRALARQAVEAGRGFVLLHHALGDNQDWPWWYEEVTGGLLVLDKQNGKKPSVVSTAAKLDVRPTGTHPILRNVAAFTVANEEVYKNMWQSPKITPLLQTTHSGSDSNIGWIGVHPAARVVCIQLGASRETHRHPAYRMLVRNAILWAAGRI